MEINEILPKDKVIKKDYPMCQLPVSKIEDKGIVFVSNSGLKLRIFPFNLNKHNFYDAEDDEIDNLATYKYSEGYAVSAEYMNGIDEKDLFEQPILSARGHIKLYSPEDATCGYFKEEWERREEWPQNRSAFDAKGNLLVNMVSIDGIIIDHRAAYIPSIKAFYFEGVLYYEQ